jgi:hypothetical protein
MSVRHAGPEYLGRCCISYLYLLKAGDHLHVNLLDMLRPLANIWDTDATEQAGAMCLGRSAYIGSFHFLPPYCIQLLWCTHEICKLLFCMQLKPYKKHRVGVYRCSTVVRTHHIHRSTNVNWNACYIFSVAWLIVCSTFSLWICY